MLNYKELEQFTYQVFKTMGCSSEDAQLASNVLIKADLRGIDSHGVARLSGYYRLFEAGRINPKPNITIQREKKGVFSIDGDAGLGLVIAPKTMQIVLEKTEQFGASYAAISNSNHFGIAAYHAMMALEKNYIGMAMTNASPLVAPTFGTQRMLGTNPICYAIPAGKELPFVLDMATSAAANGKLEIAERKNEEIPEGWVETKDGNTSVLPTDLKKGGYLLPLGSNKEMGSHKGYGLGSLVDILSGVLSGANFGPWVPPFVSFLPVLPNLPGKGIGHFLGAMDVDGFIEIQEFKNRMDLWIQTFKKTESKKGKKVAIHGEFEFMEEKIRLVEGISVDEKVCEDLTQLAMKLKLDHPF